MEGDVTQATNTYRLGAAILRLILKRTGQAFLVSAAVATLCFFAMHSLPGDAAQRIAAARFGQHNVTQDLIEEVRRQEGLDRPVAVQYVLWVRKLARGDFGYSQISRRPVLSELVENGRETVVLGALGWLVSYLVSVPLGISAALKRGHFFDRISVSATAFLTALPPFVVGTMLIGIFAFGLRWLPSAGDRYLVHLVLPVMTISLTLMPFSFRVVRDVSNRVLNMPYIVHAELQGLNKGQAFRRHGPRNIAVPVVTFASLQFLYLVESLVVVETLFARSGVGSWIMHAVIARDVNVIVTALLFIAMIYSLVTMLADIACMLIDPRIGGE